MAGERPIDIHTWDDIVLLAIESPLYCGSPLVSIYMGPMYPHVPCQFGEFHPLISSPDLLVNKFAISCLSILWHLAKLLATAHKTVKMHISAHSSVQEKGIIKYIARHSLYWEDFRSPAFFRVTPEWRCSVADARLYPLGSNADHLWTGFGFCQWTAKRGLTMQLEEKWCGNRRKNCRSLSNDLGRWLVLSRPASALSCIYCFY